jgi:hypothetical protein
MEIQLSDDEAHILRLTLDDYLPELKREVAFTDAHKFRHEMLKRQEVCEKVLDLLKQAGA